MDGGGWMDGWTVGRLVRSVTWNGWTNEWVEGVVI